MPSIGRRAAAQLYKILTSAANPGGETGRVILFSKVVSGVAQLFAQVSNGDVFQMTPSAGVVITNYVATGAEGTDFMVNLSQTMNNDAYELAWAPKGVTAIPILDLPDGVAGDRTTTQFRVLLAVPLTAGDKLVFFAFPT